MTYLKVTSGDVSLLSLVDEMKDEIKVTISDQGYNINWKKNNIKQVKVIIENKKINIYASDLPHFMQGLAEVSKRYINNKMNSFTWEYSFNRNGLMLDNSRNSVANVDYLKKLIRKHVAMGHTWFMLYLEDTYELKGEPYFGAYRGRYSQDELREISKYGNKLGVEVFPAIQTLAHINQFLYWEHEFKKYGDIDDIFNVGRKTTKELIKDMISQISSCFISNKIHLGMDEAYNLGKGTYLKEFGLKNNIEIMMEHLELLIDHCHSLGLEAIIWDDMFFAKYSEMTEVSEIEIPDNLNLMYWDYYSTDVHHYQERIKSNKKLTKDIMFAGGAWRWSGFVPHHRKTLETTIAALTAVKEQNIKNVIVTAWGDDGSEAPLNSVEFGMVLYSHLDKNDKYEKQLFNEDLLFYTGLTFNDWLKQGSFDLVEDAEGTLLLDANPSKYFLYQDLLMPVFQPYIESINIDYGERMDDLAEYFDTLKRGDSLTNNMWYNFAKLLKVKWDLPLKIYDAYHANDKIKMQSIVKNELPTLIFELNNFLVSRRSLWLYENKSIGLEVIEYRIGAMITRSEMVIMTLNDWINNKAHSIPELEEKRLNPIPHLTPEKDIAASYNRTERIMSRNTMSW